jgi:hypothetical protein
MIPGDTVVRLIVGTDSVLLLALVLTLALNWRSLRAAIGAQLEKDARERAARRRRRREKLAS